MYKTKITQEQARKAFYWTSMNPEKRGEMALQDHQNTLDGMYEEIKKVSENAEEDYLEFCQKADDLYTSYLSSHSNVASSMVTGPSNFPIERNRKRMSWADGHLNNYVQYVDNAVKKIEKKYKQKETPATRLESLQMQLEERSANQNNMKAINKAYKIYKTKGLEALDALKLEEADKKIVLSHDDSKSYSWERGRVFPAYSLTNNNARIRQISDDIARLEKMQEKGNTEKENEFCKVIENTEIGRIQLIFNDKPEKNIREILKSNGFKWSPSQNAWQRHLNNNGIYAAQKVITILNNGK